MTAINRVTGSVTMDCVSDAMARPGRSTFAGIRWLVVAAALGMLVMPGCDRDSKEGAGHKKTERSDEEPDTSQPDGDDRPTEKRDWSNQVKKALKKGKKEVARQRKEELAERCTLFPDTCPPGEACYVTARGKKECAPITASKSVGDECGLSNDCNAGQQCVGGRPGTCLETCNPRNLEDWGCPPGRICIRVTGKDGQQFAWGVCRSQRDQCRPWPDDSCDIGEACLKTRVGRRCVAYDTDADIGDPCRAANECMVGHACVKQGAGPRRCRQKCDAEHACASGQCAPLDDRPFGFCVEGSTN